MEKILEKSGKSQGILSVRKSGNPAYTKTVICKPFDTLLIMEQIIMYPY